MPNKASAKKALRQSVKRRVLNDGRRRTTKTTIKAARKAMAAGSGDAGSQVNLAVKAIDKAAKARVMHRNKAARLKSQLQKKAAKKA